MQKNRITPWIQASRLPSQGYIFFPLLLGQALWFSQSGRLNFLLAMLTWGFGIVIQIYIVYANDWADVAIDRLNETFTPFSGGSRVLVEAKLTVRQIKVAVAITVALAIVIGLIFLFMRRPLALWLVLVSLALLWAYSFPPVRLSYRGGGELLQLAGVGVVLPVLGYYVQSGSLSNFPWPYVAVLLPLQLACAFSTTLPDEPSDRVGGKRTIAVIVGGKTARYTVLLLHFLTLLLVATFMLSEYGITVFLAVTAISMVAMTGMVFSLTRAVPGSHAMLHFVMCSILATIGLTGSMAVERFLSS